EDDFEDISDTTSFKIMDTGSKNAKTYDFDDDDVKKTIDTYGVKHQNTIINERYDPYVQRTEGAAEKAKVSEAENARREFLRKSNTVPLDNPDALEKAEKIPAYLRRGTKLDEDSIRVL